MQWLQMTMHAIVIVVTIAKMAAIAAAQTATAKLGMIR